MSTSLFVARHSRLATREMAKGRQPSPALSSRLIFADMNVRAIQLGFLRCDRVLRDRAIQLGFLRCDRVLRGLGHAELHDRLCLDLDWFAGLRVASHASLAVRLHQASESGHNEYSVLLGLFDRNVSEVLKKRCCSLVVGAEFLGQMTSELGFGHT